MSIILAIIIGILILLFLVFIHELGHFLTAKFFGIKVLEFGFGFPPRAWGKKKGETVYSVNWIPAGGFVRLLGEEEDSQDPRSFSKKPPLIRGTVVAAGVVINFLLAVILFYGILGFSSFQAVFDQNTVQNRFLFGTQENFTFIANVSEGSSAELANLKFGDKIISADGKSVGTIAEFSEIVQENPNEQIVVEVQNLEEDNIRTVVLVPKYDEELDRYLVGVGLGGDFAIVKYESPTDRIFSGFMHAGNNLQFQAIAIASLVGQSVEEKSAEPLAENIAGPVGIVALIAQFVGIGGTAAIGALFSLTALISLILAVVNILPIPALDGGRFFFIFAEGLTGKKVNPKVERVIHGVAFIVLIFLVLIVAFNDIVNIFN